MSLRNTSGLVGHGILALPLAGLLALVGLYSNISLVQGDLSQRR
jgi:hypothetical protein